MSTTLAARAVGLIATTALASSLMVLPANALVVANPCMVSGPAISFNPTGTLVLGACFGPGAAVSVDFSDNAGGRYPWRPSEPVRASVTGLFSVPVLLTPHTWTTEYINAKGGVNGYSNDLEIPPATAQ